MSALDRSLSFNEGNILIAGRSGIGRRMCVQLTALMLRLDFVTPSITKDYALRDFKKELKALFEKATV